MKVLAVIPARGGSKGIRKKNLRLLRGYPLIDYVLRTARSVPEISEIVVSTDDEEIAEYVTIRHGVCVHHRPLDLAGDDVSLDPVVSDALEFMEKRKGEAFDIVVTLQPTSPTLRASTLKRVLTSFEADENADSYIAAIEDTHLRWQEHGGSIVPIYVKRANRQWLRKTYKETGAFLISKRAVVTQTDRLGEHPRIWPIAAEEAVDIDTDLDWLVAEAILSRLHFVFVVRGSESVGMGHVYRCLSLADSFLGNRVQFLALNSSSKAINLIARFGYECEDVESLGAVSKRIAVLHPDIVINDILDTEATYIRDILARAAFVVNFEDLGKGSLSANLVFNALYEFSSPPPNHRFGAKYVCLREEFLLFPPAPFRDPATTLFVTFGGVDENNLTVRTCRILPRLLSKSSLERVLVVLGPGYAHRAEFTSCIESLPKRIRSKTEVYESVDNMAKLMREADVAVTSNGRTVYELAAMGVPGVTIAQNDRETLHLFSRYSEGFCYLGIASNVKEEKIAEAIESIVVDRDVRAEMVKALSDVNLKSGLNRVRREIIDEYWRWKDEENNHRTAHADKR